MSEKDQWKTKESPSLSDRIRRRVEGIGLRLGVGPLSRLKPTFENLVDVDSSNLKRVGYDPDQQRLKVQFHGGRTYEYKGVPSQKYRDLLDADSKGSYFHENIRTSFPYRRLGEEGAQKEASQRTFLKRGAAEGPSNIAQDFAAGLDPFGIWTAEYGRRNQEAGLSEAQHVGKQVAGVTGGLIGSGLAVPATVSSVVRGAPKFFEPGPGGLRGRLMRGLVGMREGAAAPFKGIAHGRRGTKALRRAADHTGKAAPLSEKERESLEWLAEHTPAGDIRKQVTSKLDEALEASAKTPKRNVAGGPVDDAAQQARSNLEDAYDEFRNFQMGFIRPERASEVLPDAQGQFRKYLSGIGLTGAVGGAGAAVQYNKGRGTARHYAGEE